MADTLITDRRSSPAIYKTIRRLGKGGMAEVFLARQEGVAGFRRLAVVKRLLPQFSTVSNIAEMLLDEARIAAQLNHPNIVQIYELGEEDGQYFIAMEYVDGCDLATLARIERRRKSRVPMRLALRVLSEAAMGLDYAHRQVGLDGRPLNLVHRDVSPHNVLCSREGAVKVTDFGIAKAVGKVQVTEVGVVKGKVHYMSPEQYTGGDVDKRSDIFSLGVVLYQLTTGRLPRVSKNGQVNMRQVTEGRIPRPSEIRPDYPEELDEIVMRALAQHPDDRYQDAASLRDDLLDFARQHDLLAFPNELGDYVNALVPPQPLTEDSAEISLGGGGKKARDRDRADRARAPLKAVSSVTVDPPSTEKVEIPPLVTTRERRLKRAAAEALDLNTDIPIDSDRATLRARGRSASSKPTELEEEQPTGAREDAPSVEQASRPRPRPMARRKKDEYEPVDDGQVEDEIEMVSEPRHKRRESRPSTKRPKIKLVPPPADDSRHEAKREQPETQLARRYVLPKRFGRWAPVAIGGGALLLLVGLLYGWPRDNGGAPDSRLAPMGSMRPAAGEIDVLSDPEKAAVFVDGAQRCEQTPCRVSGLPLGRELVVTVRGKPGYDLWVQRVVLSTEQSRLMLKAALSKGSGKSEASASKGAGKKAEKEETASGSHKAAKSKRAAGRSVQPRRAARSGGGARGRKGKGKVVSVKTGTAQALMAIDVRPGWAEIWIDKQKRGHTPLQFEVEPGWHVVELKNPERNFNVSYRVNAKKGTKIKITDKLDTPAPAAS